MRIEVLLFIALIIVGGLIYYKDGGELPDMPSGFSSFSFSAGDDVDEELEELSKEETPSSATTNPKPATTPIQSEPTPQTTTPKPQTNTPVTPEPESNATPLGEALTLQKGRANLTDPAQEYLILSLDADYSSPVTISGWHVKSEKTKTSVRIPEGDRFLDRYSDRDENPIVLYPGEKAYLTTGENPLNVSFRENSCSGYLNHYGDFYPALQKSCPLPSDELLQFGNISRGDDDCYDFIDDLRVCEVTDAETLDDANLTVACERFIENTWSYRGCVIEHQNDSDFYAENTWRIYFEQRGELWKSTDETIVLQDENNNVITTLEY